jgi:nucleoside recognition membrane protein YjiH
MQRNRLIILFLAALGIGILIAWVDSQPNWDDTGITAGVVLLVCAGFGALWPRYAWLWAIAIGTWIPLLAIFSTHNYTSLMALGIAFIGAYAGALARWFIAPPTTPTLQ